MLSRARLIGSKVQSLAACSSRLQSTQTPDYKLSKFDYGTQRESASYLKEAFCPAAFDESLYHTDESRGDIDFGSCDYLAMAKDPELTKIEVDAISELTHLPQNRSSVYPRKPDGEIRQFEKLTKPWLNAETVMMCNSGLEANTIVMQLLLSGRNWPLYMDKYAHATLPFGARVAGRNDTMYFEHNSVDSLLALVKQHGPGIVAVDTVYSALGTIAPIEKIVDICRTYGCILIADEAHSIGTVGDEGEGLVKHLGLEKYVHFRTMSLNKGFGLQGGLIAFNEEMAEGKEIAPYVATMTIFSLAPQDWLGRRLIATLDKIKNEKWRRTELESKMEFFRKGLLDIGYSGYYVRHTKTHVMPCVIGNVEFAKGVYHRFMENHIYPSPHFYPASPRNKSVMRFTVCNILSYEQLQKTLDFMEETKELNKPWEWPDYNNDVLNLGFEHY